MGFSISLMNFTKKTLASGLTLISVPIKDSLSVTVLVMAHTGSKYETKEINGLSHFLEHMCFKGTEKYPTAAAISVELDKIGSQSNAMTGRECTYYYAKAHPAHFDRIVDVISDIYLHSVFDPKEIEKEKGVIIEEINMYEDLPHRTVHDVFMEALYDSQPAGWNETGTKETVSGMTQKDFVEYHSKHYVGSGTTVVVAGNFDESVLQEKIQHAFADISMAPKSGKAPVFERQAEPVIRIKYKETDQTHIMLGVRSYDANNENNYPLKVLSTALGDGMSSRLFQKLREEMGVGYYIRSGVDEYTDHGYMAISVGVDNKRVAEVVSAIMSELKHFVEKPIPDDELQKSKDYLIGNMYLGLESSDSLAEYYAMQDIVTKDLVTPDQFAEKIRKVTAEEIQRVAKEIMRDERLNLAIVGNIAGDSELKRIFHF